MLIELVEEACSDNSVTGIDTQLSQTLGRGDRQRVFKGNVQ